MRVASVTELIDKHLILQTSLDQKKTPWKALWQDITDYVLPRRSWWDIGSMPGQKPDTIRYDDTAIDALQTMVDGFQGNLISSAFPWLRLVPQNPQLTDLPGIADYLEVLADVILSYYERTNLYEAVNAFIADYASIGTAVMLVDDSVSAGRIVFSTRHLKECAIAENASEEVNVLYRRFRLSNQQIVENWPETVTAEQKEMARVSPYAEHDIIHAAFPSDSIIYPTLREPRTPYTAEYIDPVYRVHLFEGGYESFPYLVARWRKNTDEVYGRSPAADAISSVLRSNQVAKGLLQAAQFASDPMMNVPDGLKGKDELVPGGRNYSARPDEIITAVDMGKNYPITRDQIEDIRNQIRDIFRSRMFALLQALEAQKAQTATWVNKVASEQAILLGPVVGRFSNEFLLPLVRRTNQILSRMRALPPPPPMVAGVGIPVKLELMGPLAQAQKRYHQSQGVQAGMEFLAGLAQLNPDALDNADFDELARIGLDSMGVPQRIIRDTDQVAAVRKAKAEAAAKQQQAEAAAAQQQTVAQNADRLNQPVKPGTMLERVTRGMAQTAGGGR
ncbi:MAG: portal protein [Coriobacteriales bacterium]